MAHQLFRAVRLFATLGRLMGDCRLRVVVYRDGPDNWTARGIEHDLQAEGRSIGETVRALLRMVQAHIEMDERHDRPPLSPFRAAPQPYWNAFTAGSSVPLSQLGALPPPHWEISVAIAHHRPTDGRLPQPPQTPRLNTSR